MVRRQSISILALVDNEISHFSDFDKVKIGTRQGGDLRENGACVMMRNVMHEATNGV